jgi:hypothetical protein
MGALALGLLVLCGAPAVARADGGADAAAAAARENAVRMERFIVSATRVERNPWRYVALPGFEVLTRASDEKTTWWLDSLQRGVWLQNDLMPKDWLPAPPVPYMVIIDDENLDVAPLGQPHSQPIILHAPEDALTWGQLAEKTNLATEPIGAFDEDTTAVNTNLYTADTKILAYGSISLERLQRCSPPLPRWLMAGLLGKNAGVLREGFDLFTDPNQGAFRWTKSWIRKAVGPGTLWISLDQTQELMDRLGKEKWPKIEMLHLGSLFSEDPPPEESVALWESEAALFVRWGLMGPGRDEPTLSHAFLELVRRARTEPVTERVFTECFGFGYEAMEGKLDYYLREVIARPTTVYIDMPITFPRIAMKAATADQIGRILGDWLRMQGDSLRNSDPYVSREFLFASGRVLERAYRDDNGLPPDVQPPTGAPTASAAPQNSAPGAPVAMKPFVVSADRIHDMSLLAVYGLYEHDMGDDAKARQFLEGAVRLGVARPRAHVVLAELRYLESAKSPQGAQGGISAQQAALVLEPIHSAPRTPEVAHLVVETWSHCDLKPTSEDVPLITDGVAHFPRDTDLAYSSASILAQAGFGAEASALIDKGLVFVSRQSTRDYFEQLRATLGRPLGAAEK